MFFSYKNISLHRHEYDEIITIWGGTPEDGTPPERATKSAYKKASPTLYPPSRRVKIFHGRYGYMGGIKEIGTPGVK